MYTLLHTHTHSVYAEGGEGALVQQSLTPPPPLGVVHYIPITCPAAAAARCRHASVLFVTRTVRNFYMYII